MPFTKAAIILISHKNVEEKAKFATVKDDDEGNDPLNKYHIIFFLFLFGEHETKSPIMMHGNDFLG